MCWSCHYIIIIPLSCTYQMEFWNYFDLRRRFPTFTSRPFSPGANWWQFGHLIFGLVVECFSNSSIAGHACLALLVVWLTLMQLMSFILYYTFPYIIITSFPHTHSAMTFATIYMLGQNYHHFFSTIFCRCQLTTGSAPLIIGLVVEGFSNFPIAAGQAWWALLVVWLTLFIQLMSYILYCTCSCISITSFPNTY